MILVDFSQVAISNIMVSQTGPSWTKKNIPIIDGVENSGEGVLDPNKIRHMVLNSLRMYRQKFGHKYGELVICTDDKNYWRKDVFPYYKANRKTDRNESKIDWNMLFSTLNTLREELKQFFPYKVLHVNSAEADDIIGVIAKEEHTLGSILILSGDKDFAQLQKYSNIDQFAPIQKKFLPIDNPIEALRYQILVGDPGDGIPNFKTSDNALVIKTRQTPLRKSDLERWIKVEDAKSFCSGSEYVGYLRNRELIDLDYIPNSIVESILLEWNTPFVGKRNNLMDYFVKHRLNILLNDITEF